MNIRNQGKEMIRKIVCTNEKNGEMIVFQKKRGIGMLNLPEDYTVVRIYKDDGDVLDIDMGLLKKKKEEGDFVRTREQDMLLQAVEGIEYDIIPECPKLTYEDITENIMFELPPINQSVLSANDNGLWAYHGFRKFKFSASGLVESIEDTDVDISMSLHFDKKDSQEIPSIKVKEFFIDKGEKDQEDKNHCCYCYIDTNRFGDEFDDVKQTLLFSGYYELNIHWPKGSYNDITYGFPIELVVNNTKYNPDSKTCRPLQNKTASIDFGTSASCVAVEGTNGIELLTISSDELNDNINVYENPTCIMIHRWKEFYGQWKLENANLPLIVKGNREREMLDNIKVEFDFGYSVKECLDMVNDEELNAILTEIKMIPNYLYEGGQRKVRPHYIQDKPSIDLVASPEEQNESSFDPVAFYAYILGKAINDVAKNRIYTKFNVTYPVKFNEELREKIRHSMEYGLRRSLPLPLRDACDKKGRPLFRVKMNQPEPIAYIGAVCGKYLQIDDKPELFAVFDFGGGTLDYSFGIFAPDPDDEDNTIIHILGVDGDSNIGGETLIKRMSYWIYVDEGNREELTQNEIQFELPKGEVLLDDCKDKLFNKSPDAMSNVRKISETISRAIFENRIEETSGQRTMELVNLKGEEESITISYNSESLNGRLREILQKKVEHFKRAMDDVFRTNEDLIKECGGTYIQKNVKIFKAGNSSKNIILEELMKEAFQENEINLVDETNVEWMQEKFGRDVQPKKIALTPKTAVAFGQINLQNFEVRTERIENGENGAPFGWYVGNIRKGNNKFIVKIKKSTPDSSWVQYCKINSTDTKIYYSEVMIDDGDDINLKSMEIELEDHQIGNFLFVRVVDSNTIEYSVCEKGKEPEGNLEYNKENFVVFK